MLPVVVGAVLACVAFGVYMTVIWRYVIGRSALGVVRWLRQHPDSEYAVRVRRWVPTVGAWNPSQPLRRNGQVFGDGVATYRLDGADRVRMTWTPRSGQPREFAGDIPPQVDVGHPEHGKRTLVLRLVVLIYVLAAAGGFAVGYAVSSGKPGARIGYGLGGVFVAMVGLWFAVTVVSVARGTRDALGRQRGSKNSS